ncbi:MAG: CRISPR-associated endonuclease Cas3'' [Syntrophomonadaceae bacterium]
MYWAKPNQSYEQHIRNCYKVWLKLWNLKEPYISRWLQDIKIPLSELRAKSLISILFHDIGKLNPLFQDYMDALRHDKKVPRNNHFRHEIGSAVFLTEYWHLRRSSGNDSLFPYEVWAVLGHHKTLDRNWASFEREMKMKEWPEVTSEALQYAISIVAEILKEEGITPPSHTSMVSMGEWKKRFFPSFNGMLNYENLSLYDYLKPSVKRQIYSIIKGILHFCDWMASATGNMEDRVLYLKYTQAQMLERMGKKAEYDSREFYLRPFQNECSRQNGNILAIAPTGSGKTEAALLWALNRPNPRVVFLMPTMVTSNSLYDRIITWYFSEEESGLSHSGAQTYFNLKGVTDSELRFKLLHNKAFIPALTVATVDQVLSAGFNTGVWTLKELGVAGKFVHY